MRKSFFHTAMSFYHSDGMTAARKQAAEFAGKGGHVATMPDIEDAGIDATGGGFERSAVLTSLSA